MVRQKAAETFRQGVEAFDQRDFETARVAFLQTLALKPSEPVVQRNLGLSEIYSGHYLDGARRLARVLQTTGEGSSEERSRMQDSLKKAELHLQRLTIEVDVDGASILVAGEELGRSPLPFAWYVEPGPFEVNASKPGYRPASYGGLAKAGAAEHVRIVLEQVPAEPAPAATPVVVAPRAPRDSEEAQASLGRAPSPWLIAGGAAIAVAGLATGITFHVLAANSRAEGDELAGGVLDAMETCDPDDPLGRMPAPQCDDITRAYERHDRQQPIAVVGYAVGASAAIATLVYGLWLAPREKSSGLAPERKRLSILPELPLSGRGYAGVLITSEF